MKEHKTEIHQGLSQNNEQIGRVQSEISSSVAIDAGMRKRQGKKDKWTYRQSYYIFMYKLESSTLKIYF